MSLFLTAVGLMMIFEGIPLFCSPSKIKELCMQLPLVEDSVLRLLGFFLMIIGLGVVYFGKSVMGDG